MLKGHVTICKVYSDGRRETVLDKHNLITTGLGSSFLDIQTQVGSTYLNDFGPHYFQVGTSAIGYADAGREASSTFYQLSAPLEWSGYGLDTDLDIVKRYRGFYASSVDPTRDDPKTQGVELLLTSATMSGLFFSGTDGYFSKIKEGRITKFFIDSFESEIILDEKTANGKDITEVGLFAKNPKGFKEDSPVLMAYRSFAALSKTEDFSLVIHWSIGFLGLSTNVDDHYTGADPSRGSTPTGLVMSSNLPGQGGGGSGYSAGDGY